MRRREALSVLCLFVGAPAQIHSATCGSALILEVSAPSAFDNIDSSSPVFAKFWEASVGGANRSDLGCASGCDIVAMPQCVSGPDCLALTGVNWLNAACGTAGHLPARTIFVVEQTSTDSGGRWAALNVDHNSTDANTDLDAKAAAICSGCASVVSPILGGTGYPSISGPVLGGSHLTANLTWTPPSAAAQALSNGSSGVVSSYGVYARIHAGSPPPSTGDRSGWIFARDLQTDGVLNGGFSTDASASVDVSLPIGSFNVTFAVGLNFDGTGDPTSDPNVQPSSFISDQSDPVAVVVVSGIFADGFESGSTSEWSATTP